MASEDTGTMEFSPPLLEGQFGTIQQRMSHYVTHFVTIAETYLPPKQALDLTFEFWVGVQFTICREVCGGDETKLWAIAYRMRDEMGGDRPMANGYLPPSPEADANRMCDALGNPRRRHSRGIQ